MTEQGIERTGERVSECACVWRCTPPRDSPSGPPPKHPRLLGGVWSRGALINFDGGVGPPTIRLPRDVGVRVEASGGIGSINVTGLKKRGRGYVNDAYGKSPVTLRIEVKGGIGSIEIEG